MKYLNFGSKAVKSLFISKSGDVTYLALVLIFISVVLGSGTYL